MKILNWKKKTLSALVATGAIVAGSSQNADAEVLEFDGLGGNGTGIPDTFGDNLAGTPNIDLTWGGGGWDSYNTWDGRGEVAQTDYGTENPIGVLFTPDAGFGVFVDSFDLDEFTGGGDSVVEWALLDGGTTLFSGTWDDFSDANAGDGGRTTITTGMNAGNALFGDLTLQLTGVTGATSYQALDNLSFNQVSVPEPGSASLLACGIGAMLLRRRKRN